MADGHNSKLTRFGVTVGAKPRVEKRTYVDLDGRQVGVLGYDKANDTRVYVSERMADRHRYYGNDPQYDLSFDGVAYGISLDLFRRIDGWGATRIYIAESDERDVHYFAFSQFVDGHTINEAADDDSREKDLQNVVPVSEAIKTWDDHLPALYAKTF